MTKSSPCYCSEMRPPHCMNQQQFQLVCCGCLVGGVFVVGFWLFFFLGGVPVNVDPSCSVTVPWSFKERYGHRMEKKKKLLRKLCSILPTDAQKKVCSVCKVTITNDKRKRTILALEVWSSLYQKHCFREVMTIPRNIFYCLLYI